ncbi:MAG: ribonuclease HI [Firmicutes bacterium]|nr:ribonuclease HI [Bacillota bacterium]
MKNVTIYTDGACSGNPGPGGWAAILICNGAEKILSGYEKDTTNNRMELMGVIEALKALKTSCNVKIYSDSAYFVNAIKLKWLNNWQKNSDILGNWRTASKGEVKNVDLWKQYLTLSKNHNIEVIWVKGHADNELNNRCDKIAREEIKNF